MVTVKKSFLPALPMLFLSFLFCSCGKVPVHNRASEVDLNSKLPVQIEYRQFIYKCEIENKAEKTSIDFCGNGDFPDGFSYVCDGEECILSYEGLTKSYNCRNLPKDYLPIILNSFFSSFEGSIVTEGYDELKGCSYVKRTVNDSFITFEVYNQGENTAYNIIIN